MVKRAYFCAIGLSFAVLSAVNAQESAQIPEDFDPLEERFKIEAAYIPNYREMMRAVIVALGQNSRENRPEFQIILDGGQDLLTRGQWENDLDDLHRAEMAGAQTDDERFLLKLFSPEHPVPAGAPVRRYIMAVNGLLAANQICAGETGRLSPGVEKIV